MWIAAHPDDEAVAAPLLAAWCREQQARCTFLILTRGQAGVCLRVEGCLPDVATVRSAEAAAASQFFGADLILLSLPDGGGSAVPSWGSGVERLELVSRVEGYIRAIAPELVLTFDPRHGTTCHPDHRSVGSIVLDAIESVVPHPSLYFLETRVSILNDPFNIRFQSADAAALRYDANAVFTAGSAWDAVTADMRRHPSQFNQQWLAAIDNVPREDRAVFIAQAADTLARAVVMPCP